MGINSELHVSSSERRRPRVSGLRVVLTVLAVLALLPATALFGPYGFLAGLVLLVLTALAE